MAIGDVVHAFGENGELSRGAQNALSAYATLAYVDARVFPVGMGDPIPSSTDLPPEGDKPGDARLAMDTMHLWVWDSTSSTWLDMGTVRGESLTLTTGTVTTLPPGENATFTLVGPEPNYTVNVGLPEGQPAEQPDLSATATTLAPGAEATATVTGTYPNLTLTLGIPEGEQGEGLHILGDKATVGDLPSSGNAQGDAWMVGAPGGDLYVWDGAAWVNIGPLGASDWADISNKPSTFPPSSHSHVVGDVTGLQGALDGKVPTTRKVNGKALSSDVSLTAADVNAIPSSTRARLPFVNPWNGSAWTYASLASAQAAGLVAGQIVWHVGGPSAPGWARSGDVFSVGS